MDNYLNIVLVVLAVSALLAVVVWFSNYRIRQQTNMRYQQGIDWLQQLRELLTAVQQHRGLTNGYLNGDESAKIRIAELQRQIGQAIAKLNQQGPWIQRSERWKSIQDHWARLSTNYINHQASYALEQHNRLVLNVLHLIEDCAEQHHLQELQLAANQPAEELWKSTLFNAEYIGQARALGTGVAASAHCSSVERIRLKYLHSKLEEYQLSVATSQIKGKLSPLLSSIETNVMVSHPSIQPSAYFALATEALDSVIVGFDQGLEQLNRQIKTS
ncbi:nitrate- and nitrite sensing domain-containing protein [Neiella sp. HB171785]|uniref:Nitrate- and nitrite sensing domain-containing protein n=1 Tax=Neiella litorisoli TaxID=2771431 RepID=A0A8J6QL97_9GAMM|nr:nitrate- and nitrite sensing domain-containing protein [Neiella litorisoli]MBD1390431.1 nitrate- and nitrite sensing domain-containing protein [Neiella litorisoli]